MICISRSAHAFLLSFLSFPKNKKRPDKIRTQCARYHLYSPKGALIGNNHFPTLNAGHGRTYSILFSPAAPGLPSRAGYCGVSSSHHSLKATHAKYSSLHGHSIYMNCSTTQHFCQVLRAFLPVYSFSSVLSSSAASALSFVPQRGQKSYSVVTCALHPGQITLFCSFARESRRHLIFACT